MTDPSHISGGGGAGIKQNKHVNKQNDVPGGREVSLGAAAEDVASHLREDDGSRSPESRTLPRLCVRGETRRGGGGVGGV